MPRLMLRGVSFAYDDAHPLFRALTLDLAPGGYGLVGENGAGKSTLLALVAGELQPDEGHVRVDPDGGVIVHCPQRVELPDAAVRALASRSSDGEDARLFAELGLSPDALERWDTLSPGERKRWQVGAALSLDPDVLLLDEPTNHLDGEGRRWLVTALRRWRGVGLYVSHDRALLDELTTSTLRVSEGTVARYAGAYSAAKATWEAEAERRRELRARDVRTLVATERRLADARDARASAARDLSARARSKGKHDSDGRSVTAQIRVEWAEAGHGRRVARERTATDRARAAVEEHEVTKSLGRSVFVGWAPAPRPRVLGLQTAAVHAGERLILRDVSLALDRAARVHLAGANGAGKTTLLEALVAGSTVPRERLLYLPQELGRAREQEALASLRALPRELRSRTSSLVAALGLDPDRLLASRAPSPGEARKLLLAEGLARHVWAVVLDEPTNHLDLPSIERVEAALAEYPGALLVVSHDPRFAARLTDTRWQLELGPDGVGRVSVS